jgi:hypothetical protein
MSTTKTTTSLLTLAIIASFAGAMISVPQIIGSVKADTPPNEQACHLPYVFNPGGGGFCVDGPPNCPAGTHLNTQTNKCEAEPICPQGTTFNPSTNKCEANPTCPQGSAFNPTTHKCEANPTCPPTGSDKVAEIDPTTGLCKVRPGNPA